MDAELKGQIRATKDKELQRVAATEEREREELDRLDGIELAL